MLTSAHLSGLARRFDGSTLLNVMVSRFSPSAVVARCFLLYLLHLRHLLFREYHQRSSMVSVLAASSIICSISARVAPDFFRNLMGLPLDVLSTCTSRSRLFPTSSVTGCGHPSLASASPSGRLLVAMYSRRPLISWLCSSITERSCWFDRSSLTTRDSIRDVFSSRRSASVGSMRRDVQDQMPTKEGF